MARSLSSARQLTALVVDGVSNSFISRGYATAAVTSQEVVSSLGSCKMTKKQTEDVVGSTEKTQWVPDPVTGYYRPENRVGEVDVAELRATLLKQKN